MACDMGSSDNKKPADVSNAQRAVKLIRSSSQCKPMRGANPFSSPGSGAHDCCIFAVFPNENARWRWPMPSAMRCKPTGVQTPANLGLQSVARAMQRCSPPHRILARKDPSNPSAASAVSDSVRETRSPLALNPSSPHHRTNSSPKAVICCRLKQVQNGQTSETVDRCAKPYPACPLASEVFEGVAHLNHCFLTALSRSATA